MSKNINYEIDIQLAEKIQNSKELPWNFAHILSYVTVKTGDFCKILVELVWKIWFY